MTIEELDLSVRSLIALSTVSIRLKTISKTEADMMKVRNLSWKSLDELSKLEAMDLSLASEES